MDSLFKNCLEWSHETFKIKLIFLKIKAYLDSDFELYIERTPHRHTSIYTYTCNRYFGQLCNCFDWNVLLTLAHTHTITLTFTYTPIFVVFCFVFGISIPSVSIRLFSINLLPLTLSSCLLNFENVLYLSPFLRSGIILTMNIYICISLFLYIHSHRLFI